MPSSLLSSPTPHHRGGALRLLIVNDWKRSFVAASVLDFALVVTMSLEDLVTDADDKLFNRITALHCMHAVFPMAKPSVRLSVTRVIEL